ncbi:MAG: hypothetical protein IKI76_07435 [Selenomonadaceae bacterium]|nr:hypothetical protein [Selenomonadaceae bacterium]
MTKNKAYAISKYLATQCDEAHIFVAKVGSGCLCDVRTQGDAYTLLTMFFTLIDRTFKNLKVKEQDEFCRLLAQAIKLYVEEEYRPPKPQENISDKQRKKRISNNEKIISAIENVI